MRVPNRNHYYGCLFSKMTTKQDDGNVFRWIFGHVSLLKLEKMLKMTIVILSFKSILFPAGNIAIKQASRVTSTALLLQGIFGLMDLQIDDFTGAVGWFYRCDCLILQVRLVDFTGANRILLIWLLDWWVIENLPSPHTHTIEWLVSMRSWSGCIHSSWTACLKFIELHCTTLQNTQYDFIHII